MPAQNDKRTGQGLPTSGRKAYQAPQLCCYGDVGAITQQISGMTGNDGATKGNSKTA